MEGTAHEEGGRGRRLATRALLAFAVFAALVAAALVLSRDRRRTVVDLGIGAAVTGVVLVVG